MKILRLLTLFWFLFFSASKITAAYAGNILDFFENFKTAEVVVKTNFDTSPLDLLLLKGTDRGRSRSRLTEVKLEQLLRQYAGEKSRDQLHKEINTSGASCRNVKSTLSCELEKYQITRNAGNSDGPFVKRLYEYQIAMRYRNEKLADITVKYKYHDIFQ